MHTQEIPTVFAPVLYPGIGADSSADILEMLIAALPEVYQPIYGHPALSSRASRACEDRLAAILPVYRMLETKLKRPLRVLDLGCAQGFFSFRLAELGASVHGVDFLSRNILLCNALAAENPDCDVRFEQGLVESVVTSLEHDQYDLVLGLSVFHHLVRRHGVTLTQKLLSVVAEKSAVGIFEMALATEPASWAAAQPADPRDLLPGYAFVHEYARHTHHLSVFWRPMYVASNRYWFLNGQMEAFHSWKSGSHTYASTANQKTRRYFFGDGHIVKQLTLNDPAMQAINLQEYSDEIAFLTKPPAGFSVPQLFLAGQHQNEAWLVRACLPGELLCDMIVQQKTYDTARVIRDVLEQLASLEAAGLYHNDLRPANILITPEGGARLIDFGSITRDKKDRRWPHDLFLAFMIFMQEAIRGRMTVSNTERAAAFNPATFPDPYRHALWQLYARPSEAWGFGFLRDCLAQPFHEGMPATAVTRESLNAIMQAMENACKIYQDAALHLMSSQGGAGA